MSWLDNTISWLKKLACLPGKYFYEQDPPIDPNIVDRIYKDLYKSIPWIACEGVDLTDSQSKKIKVMSYNILATSLIRNPSEWDKNREERICDAILNDMPDIIGIQEADSVKEACLTRLKGVYDYVYYRNPMKQDGLLTLYKKDRFKLLEEKRIDYATEAFKYEEEFGRDTVRRFTKGQNLLHLMNFQDLAFKGEKKRVCVSNTHLYWNPDYDDIKLFQTVIHWNAITEFAGCHDANMDEEELKDLLPVISMGDYNSLPSSNAMQIIDWQSPDENRIICEQNRKLVFDNQNVAYKLCDAEKLALFKFQNAYSYYNEASSLLKPIVASVELDFSDGYTEDFCTDGFPLFTNYTKGFKGVLDHIFYSDKFNLLELRGVPSINELRKAKIENCPNRVFPSDHLPIAAVLEYEGTQSS